MLHLRLVRLIIACATTWWNTSNFVFKSEFFDSDFSQEFSDALDISNFCKNLECYTDEEAFKVCISPNYHWRYLKKSLKIVCVLIILLRLLILRKNEEFCFITCMFCKEQDWFWYYLPTIQCFSHTFYESFIFSLIVLYAKNLTRKFSRCVVKINTIP